MPPGALGRAHAPCPDLSQREDAPNRGAQPLCSPSHWASSSRRGPRAFDRTPRIRASARTLEPSPTVGIGLLPLLPAGEGRERVAKPAPVAEGVVFFRWPRLREARRGEADVGRARGVETLRLQTTAERNHEVSRGDNMARRRERTFPNSQHAGRALDEADRRRGARRHRRLFPEFPRTGRYRPAARPPR